MQKMPQMPYCKPTRLNVRSAMRIDSDDPLIDGVPVHDAALGMLTLVGQIST